MTINFEKESPNFKHKIRDIETAIKDAKIKITKWLIDISEIK